MELSVLRHASALMTEVALHVVRSNVILAHGCSTVVLVCITCPATTVGTVISWALDRVRGRALGWLGPGSPKSQPHQALRGVAKLATGLASKPAGRGKWSCRRPQGQLAQPKSLQKHDSRTFGPFRLDCFHTAATSPPPPPQSPPAAPAAGRTKPQPTAVVMKTSSLWGKLISCENNGVCCCSRLGWVVLGWVAQLHTAKPCGVAVRLV